MMSIVLGSITVMLGAYGIVRWFGYFVYALKGILPICFICGGIIAIAAGISSLRKK